MAAALVPYAAIGRHGLVGDRRTAAMIAADGTVDWLCLPDYDGPAVFGALLDAARGGFWRFGPAALRQGAQRYRAAPPVLTTCWDDENGALELTDAMALPEDERPQGTRDPRILLRRLECVRGSIECISVYRPRCDFAPVPPSAPGGTITIWSSDARIQGGSGRLALERGEVVWMVLAHGDARAWSPAEATRLLGDAQAFWRSAAARMHDVAPRAIRSAVTMRLLEYAPCGSAVAAPTTSLPERIGGDWNADYRLTWIRDTSLAMATLAVSGDTQSADRYLRWLATLGTATEEPLQVVYGIRGETAPRQHTRGDLSGYRQSAPVRMGNHAYRQRQLDIFGYLADCALVFASHGGRWPAQFSALLRRTTNYVASHWREDGNGIWELPVRQHYVSSDVMCWAALDRALQLGRRVGASAAELRAWTRARAIIRDEVERYGWSDRLGAFRQAKENDVLDASALLVPLSGLLPPEDPRVRSTVEQIARHLTIDRCVFRFDPEAVPGLADAAMGQYEAAFLPCTLWLAQAFALIGRRAQAEAILDAVDRIAAPTGLLAEAIDPRDGAMAGNTPLLFSHLEYIRASRRLGRADDQAAPSGVKATAAGPSLSRPQ